MAHTLISSQTASTSATIDFTSGIDSTYDIYEFHFINCHPATDLVHFQMQANIVGGTGWNETITSGFYVSYYNEGGTDGGVTYNATYDQDQDTAFQSLFYNASNGSDESLSGILTLYNPSSTTFVKYFTARTEGLHHNGPYTMDAFAGGYFNTTSAIDEIRFKYSSGNIDAGEFKLYGVS